MEYQARLNSRASLILLYINDLPLNIQGANLVLFADNTKLLITKNMNVLFNTKL
jgi:hypothetical protein